MKYDKIRWPLHLLNFILIQWFFRRVFVKIEDDGRVSAVGVYSHVWPLTGWWSDYVCSTPDGKPYITRLRLL